MIPVPPRSPCQRLPVTPEHAVAFVELNEIEDDWPTVIVDALNGSRVTVGGGGLTCNVLVTDVAEPPGPVQVIV